MTAVERNEILDALAAVGRRLSDAGLSGDVHVVGGAAMALAYDARRTTRDVDAVFEPKLAIYEAAAAVAAERGLPPDWLNDAVKGFLVGEDPAAASIAEFEGLRVTAASPEMLLTLKVLAHRVGEDDDDVRFLAGLLGLGSASEVLERVTSVAGDARVTAQARFFVEAVMERPEPRPDRHGH